MIATHTRPILAGLLAAAVSACGGPARGEAQSAPRPAEHRHAPAAAIPDTARYTRADVRFMTDMIGHHAQAIEMARMAETNEAGAAVRRLAARVVNAQEDEIATMQQWLRDHGQPVPEVRTTGTAEAHAGHPRMSGMLTPEQMRQLSQARGAEFDRLFLTFMIQHHRGAVEMVKELFGSYGAGQDDTVFKVASDINVDQITEINRMQTMLADMLFGAAPQ